MTKGWCPPSIYLEPAVVILVKSTCSCFSDQKTAMRQDSWMRALSLYAAGLIVRARRSLTWLARQCEGQSSLMELWTRPLLAQICPPAGEESLEPENHHFSLGWMLLRLCVNDSQLSTKSLVSVNYVQYCDQSNLGQIWNICPSLTQLNLWEIIENLRCFFL